MGRRHSKYLLCNIIVAAMALTLFTMCKQVDSKTKEVIDYIDSNYNVELKSNINRIFVVNDGIGCGSCVSSFSKYVKEQVSDDNSMIIINSRGANVDLDGFEQKKKTNPNIIISHKVKSDDDVFSKLSVIYLVHSKVDTILNVNAENISKQLQYIHNRK